MHELSLWNNQLSSLPKSFSSLSQLKVLNLSWNNFIKLPDWIDSLKSLEILSLWGNKLESLPESLSQLSSLKILDLNFNKISVVPDFLRQLEKEGLIIYK